MVLLEALSGEAAKLLAAGLAIAIGVIGPGIGIGILGAGAMNAIAVSYTHLTLPTNTEV